MVDGVGLRLKLGFAESWGKMIFPFVSLIFFFQLINISFCLLKVERDCLIICVIFVFLSAATGKDKHSKELVKALSFLLLLFSFSFYFPYNLLGLGLHFEVLSLNATFWKEQPAFSCVSTIQVFYFY